MGEIFVDEASGGVTILGDASPPESTPGGPPPPNAPGTSAAPVPSVDAKAQADQTARTQAEALMRDPANGYWDRAHPKYTETRAKVREIFRTAAGEAPPASEKVTAPAEPANPRDRVPASVADYAITLPDPPEGQKWDEATVARFKSEVAAPAKLSLGQAEDLMRAFTVYVAPRIAAPGGLDNLTDPGFLRGMGAWFDQRNFSEAQVTKAVEWFLTWAEGNVDRIQVRPTDMEPSPEAEEIRALMSDLDGPYRNVNHPRHRATRAKVSAYFARNPRR